MELVNCGIVKLVNCEIVELVNCGIVELLDSICGMWNWSIGVVELVNCETVICLQNCGIGIVKLVD